MKKSVLTLLGIACGGFAAFSQSVGPSTLNAAGGSAVVAGNTYEWSVGEMTVVSTFESAGLVVTQGVLQPAATPTTGINEHTISSAMMQVYPNPASNVLNIQPNFGREGKLSYQLQDVTGRTMLDGEEAIASGKSLVQLSLNNLVSGSYLLQVSVKTGKDTYRNVYKVQKL
jgi:hypothetical protein